MKHISLTMHRFLDSIKKVNVVVTSTYATAEQLLFEFQNMTDADQQMNMLSWAKDPENPNPNASRFYDLAMEWIAQKH